MKNLFRRRDFNDRTKKFITDNSEEIIRTNRMVLLYLSPFFTVMMAVYWAASKTAFAAWNVTNVYRNVFWACMIITAYLHIYFKRAKRSVKQVSLACMIFQLSIMAFVGFVSIYPSELRQPAVYFVPVMLGFCCAFIYSWHANLIVICLEGFLYLAAAFYFKPLDVFFVDLFCCILGMFMATFLVEILLSNQIKAYEAREKFRILSITDALTGLYNKAASQQYVTEYFDKEEHESCTFMIIDIDEFKSINDNYGHQFGDEVLTAVGEVLKDAAKDKGFAGRIGGDEFIVFLYDSEPGLGEDVASHINRQIHKVKDKELERRISCSIGIFYNDKKQSGYDRMYACADKALYRAKAGGKNTFFSYDEALYQIL